MGPGLIGCEKVGREMEMCPSAAKAGHVYNIDGLKPVPFTEARTLQGLSPFLQGPESSVACLLLLWTRWLVFKNYYKGLFEATYNYLASNVNSFQLRRLPHRRYVLPDALVSSLCSRRRPLL